MEKNEQQPVSPVESDNRFSQIPEEHRQWILEWTEGGTNTKRFEAFWGVYGSQTPKLGKLKQLIISAQNTARELGNPDIIGPVSKE